jgi:hypothetical protein
MMIWSWCSLFCILTAGTFCRTQTGRRYGRIDDNTIDVGIKITVRARVYRCAILCQLRMDCNAFHVDLRSAKCGFSRLSFLLYACLKKSGNDSRLNVEGHIHHVHYSVVGSSLSLTQGEWSVDILIKGEITSLHIESIILFLLERRRQNEHLEYHGISLYGCRTYGHALPTLLVFMRMIISCVAGRAPCVVRIRRQCRRIREHVGFKIFMYIQLVAKVQFIRYSALSDSNGH